MFPDRHAPFKSRITPARELRTAAARLVGREDVEKIYFERALRYDGALVAILEVRYRSDDEDDDDMAEADLADALAEAMNGEHPADPPGGTVEDIYG